MPVIPAPAGPTHDLGPTRFTSLATPQRGTSTTSVWQVEIEPGTPPTPHSLTAEEVFIVLGGTAMVRFGTSEPEFAHPGDAVVVPPGVRVEVAVHGDLALRMLCCMPVGGQGYLDDGVTFTPPWAA